MIETQVQTKSAIGLKIGLAVLAFGVLAAAAYVNMIRTDQVEIKANGFTVMADLARTETERAQGLAGRNDLAENRGMLFVYDGYFLPGFWMKGMNFPIDIIWLKDGMVVGLVKNAPLASGAELTSYQPPTFVNQVLELKAGFADRHQIKIGDKLEILGLNSIDI